MVVCPVRTSLTDIVFATVCRGVCLNTLIICIICARLASAECVSIQEEGNRVKGKPPAKELKGKGSVTKQAKEAWDYSQTRCNSALQDVFGGQMQSSTRCPKCHSVSRTFNDFLDLSVPLPQESAAVGSVAGRRCCTIQVPSITCSLHDTWYESRQTVCVQHLTCSNKQTANWSTLKTLEHMSAMLGIAPVMNSCFLSWHGERTLQAKACTGAPYHGIVCITAPASAGSTQPCHSTCHAPDLISLSLQLQLRQDCLTAVCHKQSCEHSYKPLS